MDTRLLVQCINEAHAANARGEFSAAIRWARQALQLAPDLPQAWYQLGVALGGSGERVEALAALERTRACTLDSAEAQNNIGFQLAELGALSEADRCFPCGELHRRPCRTSRSCRGSVARRAATRPRSLRRAMA